MLCLVSAFTVQFAVITQYYCTDSTLDQRELKKANLQVYQKSWQPFHLRLQGLYQSYSVTVGLSLSITEWLSYGTGLGWLGLIKSLLVNVVSVKLGWAVLQYSFSDRGTWTAMPIPNHFFINSIFLTNLWNKWSRVGSSQDARVSNMWVIRKTSAFP